MATLQDVARLAGVSAQTVSNVVNGRDVVSPGTRTLVEKAIVQLNYRPNSAARGLRTSRSHTLGFIVVDPSPRYLADPFHGEVLSGLADVTRSKGYGLFIESIAPGDAPERLLRPLREQRVDGAVFTLAGPTQVRQRYLAALALSQEPFVLLEQRIRAPQGASILGENRRGAALATRHLLSRGHRSFAFLQPRVAWPAVEERLAGHRAALKQSPIKAKTRVVECTWETPEAAFSATRRLLRQHPGITAILGANDRLAVGALQALQALGRAVPAEVAVMGFDDFAFAQYVRPRLSTVRLPGYEMGCAAAELLLARLTTGSFPRREVHVETAIVLRETA
jgi:DNA-binding LacI/PurR family transcriptional regulator